MLNEHSPLEEIEQARTEKQLELQQAIQSYEIISAERHQLQRQILEIRIKLKDLDIPWEKAKANKELIRSEAKVLEDWYWTHKNP